MIIFIDTNLIYGHWHLHNANFQYLLNFLENTNSTLAISEIVCDEIDNKYFDELNGINIALRNNLKKYEALINKSVNLIPNDLDNEYSFRKLIQERSDNVKLFPFSAIGNDILVKRAIKKIKPFKEDDKGFRDTLIWLSFLEYLKFEDDKDVIFINNNSSDFYNSDKSDFHDDLKIDIQSYNLGKNFKVFESIKDFINSEVGDKHKYTANSIMEQFIYPQESEIEKIIEQYINSQPAKWFSDLLKVHSRAFDKLEYFVSFMFNIVEGIEDPELLNWEQIDENVFFGELRFFLRIVEIQLMVPKIIYDNNYSSFSKIKSVVEFNNDHVIVTIITKIFMNISFNFNTKENLVENLEINMFGPL